MSTEAEGWGLTASDPAREADPALDSLRDVRRAAYLFGHTPLDTPADVTAANRVMHDAMVEAGWRFQPEIAPARNAS